MPTLTEIADRQERLMAMTFADAVANIKNGATVKDIERAIAQQNYPLVLTLLGLDDSAFEPLVNSLRDAYRTGGITGAAQLGAMPLVGGAGTVVARFNIQSPEAQRWLTTNSSRLITEIVPDQRRMIIEQLDAGLRAGRNPRTTALDLVGRIDPLNRQRTGGYIGMTSNQAQWVENARSELESLNPNYLTRQLRDKRFDSTVRKAIESGEPLKADQIDRAITQMQGRTLKYRGDVIARTESINALRAGQHESFAQAINNGEVDVGDAKRTWDATGGPRTRDAHMAMEGQERDWGVPFDGPDGSQLMYPGDTSMGAPAAMTIQCRCRERTEIDYAGKLKRLEGFA